MKRYIPNTITCLNLCSGCVATMFAFEGNIRMALLWVITGAVFDFFDGMSARLLHVSSPIGKELDSLADVVTFGVAPATMVMATLSVTDYPSFASSLQPWLPYLAFVIAAFSALRLAKFNLDTRQTTSFIGLPTPANALFWGSLLASQPQWIDAVWAPAALLAMALVSSWLLVSEVPMFALKFKQWGWKGNEVKYVFVILSAAILLASCLYSGLSGMLESIWMIISLYVAISVALSCRK